LCNELALTGSSSFDAELRKIIYTHVPEEQQLGYASLDELLDFKVSELEQERQQLAQTVSKLNSEIVSVERKLTPRFKASLGEQLAAKRHELAALEAAKPTVVDDPLESEEAKKDTAEATARLDELDALLKQIAADERTTRQRKADAVRGGAHVARILQAVKNYQKSHQQFMNDVDAMLAEVPSDLKAADIVKIHIDTSAVKKLETHFKEASDAQDAILNDATAKGLAQRRLAVETESATIKGQLGEKQRLFLVYKEQLAQWEARKVALTGDEGTIHTIAWYTAEIEGLTKLPARRDELRGERSKAVRNIHKQLGKIVQEYSLLYEPVQSFVASTAQMDMPLPLAFNVRIMQDGFQEAFLSRINRQARGSFAGVDESNRLVHTLLQETDFTDADSTLSFVDKIDDMLHHDCRDGAAKTGELSVPDQLRKGNQPEALYDYVFDLSYLAPKYSLTYSGQEISQLSPGERGLLLLVFYLLVDKDDIPLVIDQPEENLDNQTIYKILVTCIKTAKKKRQVIMVTHNPNLAVVCDAEQIIYASCDKVNKVLSYESGAIESPAVKARVVEILEGTQPAFDNRKLKYAY
jgi:DNA repair exonuclease SbcCD ATPase subunit